MHTCKVDVVFWQDGLLSQGFGNLVNKIHQQIPRVSSSGRRLQVSVEWCVDIRLPELLVRVIFDVKSRGWHSRVLCTPIFVRG